MVLDKVDDSTRNILYTIGIFLALIWWWFKAKAAASRKYVLLLGICFIIVVVTYIIGASFNIHELWYISILAALIVPYFYIKAILSERRAKKE